MSIHDYSKRLLCLCLPVLSAISTSSIAGQGYGQPSYSPSGSSTPYIQHGIITVQMANTGASVILGGTVVPLREATLAAQTPGRVEYLAGQEGDWFEEGDMLVAIDDDDLIARRQQALAALGGQATALQNAQVQYSREFWAPQSRSISRAPGMGMPAMFDMFFTRNMGSGMGMGNPWLERHADLYSQGANVGQAQSQHWGAVSRLQEADAMLRDSQSLAPFTGVIVKKLVEIGDTVQPGQALLRYADTQELQLQVEVPARLMAGLKQDMIVRSMLDVGERVVNARVAQIYPMADMQRHTVTVKLDLPTGIPAAPGMYAEIMIPDTSAPVQSLPVIPNSAVVWRGSLPAVYVLNQENKTELRLVRLGEIVDPRTVSVLSGVRPGERLFATPPPGMSSDWTPQAQDAPNSKRNFLQ